LEITREAVRKKYHKHAFLYDLDDLVFLGAKHVSRRRVIKCAGITKGKLVLDLMSGTAELTILAAREGGTVTGVDFSKTMLDIARRKVAREGLRKVSFVEANAEKLPFPDNHFDVVVCSFGLDTVYDPVPVVHEMKRVVKENGLVVTAYKSFPLKKTVCLLEKGIELYLKYFWKSKSVDAKALFKKAGMKHIQEELLYAGMVRVITARKT